MVQDAKGRTIAKYKGVLKGDKVIVPSIDESRALYKLGFFGKFLGKDKIKIEEVDSVNSQIHLSPLEALYLVELGLLEVVDDNSVVDKDTLRELVEKRYEHGELVYELYRYFRDRGYVVRSGLKFGSLYAVYEKGPGIDHAPMLVHLIDPGRNITALDVTRAARLSHTVRKTFVLAVRHMNSLKLIGFEWWTP
ncbi:tRNA-intron lyase [Caldivirga sp.]|uniref:tRNA-intron lyase n=1 Tax=Caldivirga sp. TaxID=2080243 RepID=UPI003D116775